MKKYYMIFCFSLFVIGTFAQEEDSIENKTNKKLIRQQKLEQKKLEAEATSRMVDWMVNHRNFVLEADYLTGENGNRVLVSSQINFIVVDSDKLTVQLAFVSGIGGGNGMGGITLDGIITKFDVQKSGKSGNYYTIKILAKIHVGSFNLLMTVNPDGSANASLGGNYSGRLSYHGMLVPVSKSRVFKGMTS